MLCESLIIQGGAARLLPKILVLVGKRYPLHDADFKIFGRCFDLCAANLQLWVLPSTGNLTLKILCSLGFSKRLHLRVLMKLGRHFAEGECARAWHNRKQYDISHAVIKG